MQDGCGKHDFVHLGAVVRIDRLWRHFPFAAIDRLPQLVHLAFEFELPGAHDVADEIGAIHRQRRVVTPAIGIADLRRELGQLGQCLLLRPRAHPVQPGDALAVGAEEIAHQFLHARLVARRKMLADVNPPDCFAQGTFDQSNAALPAWPVFRNAAQRLAEKVEMLFDESLVEIGGERSDQVPLEIGLPGRQRHRVEQFGEAGEVAGLPHDDIVDLAADGRGGEVGRPVEAGDDTVQPGNCGLVVGLDRVAVFHLGPLRARNFRLQRQNPCRRLLGIRHSGHRQSALHVGEVGVADALQFGVIVLQVIVAIG